MFYDTNNKEINDLLYDYDCTGGIAYSRLRHYVNDAILHFNHILRETNLNISEWKLGVLYDIGRFNSMVLWEDAENYTWHYIPHLLLPEETREIEIMTLLKKMVDEKYDSCTRVIPKLDGKFLFEAVSEADFLANEKESYERHREGMAKLRHVLPPYENHRTYMK